MNLLDEVAQHILSAENEIENKATYEDVCARLIMLIQRLINSEDLRSESCALRPQLAYCSRLMGIVAERDSSLVGAVSSVQHLIRSIDTGPEAPVALLEQAIEATLLDVLFCISQHG